MRNTDFQLQQALDVKVHLENVVLSIEQVREHQEKVIRANNKSFYGENKNKNKNNYAMEINEHYLFIA